MEILVIHTGGTVSCESMEAYFSLGITRLPPLSSPAAMYIKLWLLIANGERELTEMLYRPCGSDLPPTR